MVNQCADAPCPLNDGFLNLCTSSSAYTFDACKNKTNKMNILVSSFFLPFSITLQREAGGGLLSSKIKEMVVIKTSQVNSCTYWLTHNTALGQAAGISEERYADAFETGKPPPDTGGLSEFGVGMKIAACWFADKWKVHTKALDESLWRLVEYDINKIDSDSIISQIPSKFKVVEILSLDLNKFS